MGTINEVTKTMTNYCADCSHSEYWHKQNKKMDQSRSGHGELTPSRCTQCDCPEFKQK